MTDSNRRPGAAAAGAPDGGVAGGRGGRDLRILFTVQGLRALLYGFGSVLVGSALAASGMSGFRVTLVIASMLAGFALASVAIGTRADRWGRRRTYAGLFVVMAAAGTVFALTTWPPALVIAALTGTVSVEANESGPITSLEQAMIPHAALRGAGRTRAFARYNFVAYAAGSLGALAAGGPDLFRRFFPAVPPSQRFLLAYPLIAIACAALAARLSASVEASPRRDGRRPLLDRSRGRVAGLAALFAADAFGGGFVVNTFVVYWFETRFHTSADVMGVVFFGAGLLQAASSIAAGWLGSRIGLLNTMVFTHLPSNLLLMVVPLMPTLPAAVAVLLARFAISQMDVPARQAYLASMVDPDERTAAAAYTNTARYAARPLGQLLGGALLGAAFGAPFVAAGAVKIAYDLTLLRTFRRVRLHE